MRNSITMRNEDVVRLSVIGRPYILQHRRAGGLGGSSDNPLNSVTLCGLVNTLGSCRLACEQRGEEMHVRGSWLRLSEGPRSSR